MKPRADGLSDWNICCFDCGYYAEFIHVRMQVIVAAFLNDSGWINLSGRVGSSGGTGRSKWLCPNCSMERLPDDE